MGCSLSAISDDIDRYIGLCEHFNETPRRDPEDGRMVDCYGTHANELEQWRNLEREIGETKARQQVEKRRREAARAGRAFQFQRSAR